MSSTTQGNVAQILITNVITLIGSLGAAWFVFQGSAGNSEASKYEATLTALNVQLAQAQEHIKSQRDELNQYRALQIAHGLRVIELESKLAEKTDRETIIKEFLNHFPFPIWMKAQREDGFFEMVFLNDAYTVTFGKTKTEYVGRTDFEVWPKDVAQKFHDNDNEVARSGRPTRTIERVPTDTGLEDLEVWKFTVPTLDYRTKIGGVAIKYNYEGSPWVRE